MLYLWLKLIHILSSTILFGTGIGTAAVMLYGHRQSNIAAKAVINQYVVFVDHIFTGTSGLVQPITGLLMLHITGLSLLTPWIFLSIIGYLIAAACWFPVVYFQIKIRDITVAAAANKTKLPKEYDYYFKRWFVLGWPAFFSLIGVFYLMTMKPTLIL